VSLGGSEQRPFLGCPRQDQDIVFLIDGSGSITYTDFEKMLAFVKAVMSQLQQSSTRVSPRGNARPRDFWEACWACWAYWEGSL